ncbi:MAG TPA: histidine triad nucleotide-binding protein [Burkholderiales bacterium]|nr:histidine triad nucleotide-binding protein [Burkholderiales bacterium]
MQDPNCIFCRIVRGEIPSRKVHEDDEVVAFHDIHPQAPVHFLIVPKEHIASMMDLEDEQRELFGKIMVLAPRLAREHGAKDGFRLIVNTGRVGRQEVAHVHLHIIGGGEPLGPMLPRSRS